MHGSDDVTATAPRVNVYPLFYAECKDSVSLTGYCRTCIDMASTTDIINWGAIEKPEELAESLIESLLQSRALLGVHRLCMDLVENSTWYQVRSNQGGCT